MRKYIVRYKVCTCIEPVVFTKASLCYARVPRRCRNRGRGKHTRVANSITREFSSLTPV